MDKKTDGLSFDPSEPLHQFRAFFEEPGEDAAAPEEVRVERLLLTPLDGGRLLDVEVHLTRFRFRPHVIVLVLNEAGEEVASVDVIEPVLPHLSFTLHLPPPHQGRYTLRAEVLYPTPEHMPKTPAEQRLSRGELKPLPPMRVVHRVEEAFEV
ncbi:MAG TPA: hypothetical protein G4O04_07995 [Anaerolineae bacterium]|nr:hypothetical protein [Anaerolineae bacterium]HID84710.1 hypothetical protein [Anaerolineales bacterium]HIQ09429.1 hypothetical protein [Anaerolineaceae bacterium]